MAHILLVDDSQVLRETLKRALKRQGHDVTTANDGDEALLSIGGLAGKGPVDLVITDILMPGKEGISTVSEIRSRFPDVPVLAMSGGGRASPDGYLESAKAAGAHATLTKPFSLHDLLRLTDALLTNQPPSS